MYHYYEYYTPDAPQSPHISICKRDLLRDILTIFLLLTEISLCSLLLLALATRPPTPMGVTNFLWASTIVLAKHIQKY